VRIAGVVGVVAAIARAEAAVAEVVEVAEVAKVVEVAVGEAGLRLRAWRWGSSCRRGSALLDSEPSILSIVARAERGGDDGDREEE
jgi:hypothetical protein